MSGELHIGAALAGARARLAEAGIETAALDARVLGAHAFGTSAEGLIRETAAPVPPDCGRRFAEHVARRARGEPVAYITGMREFWSLEFAVGPGCLIPRPDSEALLAALLETIGRRSDICSVLDLGTGSGCLLLALLSELPGAYGVGIDKDDRALRIARENAARLGFGARASFLRGDWAAAVSGPFDLIIANPPYIPSADIDGLARDIRDFEPRVALDGGPDGLDAMRAVLRGAGRVLVPRGLAAMEFGPGQAAAVEGLAIDLAGLHRERLVTDLAGRARGIVFRRP